MNGLKKVVYVYNSDIAFSIYYFSRNTIGIVEDFCLCIFSINRSTGFRGIAFNVIAGSFPF